MFDGIRRSRRPNTAEITFPAPTGGWVQSGNITTAPGNQAEVLDNYFPTAQGAEIRGGAALFANIGASVVRMFTYSNGAIEKLLASTATKLFDCGRVNAGDNSFAELEGLSGGDWSSTHMATAGGVFTVFVNGSDPMFYYNGTNAFPVNGASVFAVPFDAEAGAFTVGDTVTGGTSGATATILAIAKTSATAGTLYTGAITGTFSDNETITDGGTGSATANAPSGAAASSITITGVATSALTQVWNFKERLFFVEGGTLSAWYLPVESIGGAASEIDLGSLFDKGGELLFGATWSLDSGDGLDDVCIFVTNKGQIAVYGGTDPANAATWVLRGVYEIGAPLNKHAFFKAGGDLAILTEDGIIPVSEALRKDRAALSAAAITYPIEDAWRSAITQRTTDYPVSATLQQSETLLLVGTPAGTTSAPVSFVANARTGAWARYIGWDVRCSAVFSDDLYFGSSAGKVFKANTGGTDDGKAFAAAYLPKFRDLKGPCGVVSQAGITYRATARANVALTAKGDYNSEGVPFVGASKLEQSAAWGSGVWGTFVWGGAAPKTYTEWKPAYASGYSLAPVVSITSALTARLSFEILATRLRYEPGRSL